MRRSIFIIVSVLMGIALAWVGLRLWSRVTAPAAATILITQAETNTVAATAPAKACQLLDSPGPTNLKEALAIDSMYQQMPMFQTPLALVATPDKPFAVGCILPEK